MPNGQKRKRSSVKRPVRRRNFQSGLTKLSLLSPSSLKVVAWTGFASISFDIAVLRLFYPATKEHDTQVNSANYGKLRSAAQRMLGSRTAPDDSFFRYIKTEGPKLDKAFKDGVRL